MIKKYLELFLRNLLLDENNELHNRSMHISGLLKANIERLISNIDESVKSKTIEHIIELYEECGKDNVFGRSDVEKTTGLKATRASEIIKLLLENEVIEAVKGHGKGKYKFKF